MTIDRPNRSYSTWHYPYLRASVITRELISSTNENGSYCCAPVYIVLGGTMTPIIVRSSLATDAIKVVVDLRKTPATAAVHVIIRAVINEPRADSVDEIRAATFASLFHLVISDARLLYRYILFAFKLLFGDPHWMAGQSSWTRPKTGAQNDKRGGGNLTKQKRKTNAKETVTSSTARQYHDQVSPMNFIFLFFPSWC